MNRIVIIGNGFDIAHGLKTSYVDFITWYLDSFVKAFFEEKQLHKKDELLSFERDERYDVHTGEPEIGTAVYVRYKKDESQKPWILLNELTKDVGFKVTKSILLDRILINIEAKGWTDIESDYYFLLNTIEYKIESYKSLNDQLDFFKSKLAEYLKTQKTDNQKAAIKTMLGAPVDPKDVAISARRLIGAQIPNSIATLRYDSFIQEIHQIKKLLILDFNYTHTTEKYRDDKIFINHIHGSLEKPELMIFGYGDEMDKHFENLINHNENELLRNSKSIKYLETDNYRQLLEFVESGLFQVFIMGHSCGNSDRTLLNTIFEHQNCVSIKPFCYINKKGEDNYSDLTRSIYRNFKDKTLFRDRVVNKNQCTTFDGDRLV